jgi:hypothetical protein
MRDTTANSVAIISNSFRHAGVNKGRDSLSLQIVTIPNHVLIMHNMNIIMCKYSSSLDALTLHELCTIKPLQFIIHTNCDIKPFLFYNCHYQVFQTTCTTYMDLSSVSLTMDMLAAH